MCFTYVGSLTLPVVAVCTSLHQDAITRVNICSPHSLPTELTAANCLVPPQLVAATPAPPPLPEACVTVFQLRATVRIDADAHEGDKYHMSLLVETSTWRKGKQSKRLLSLNRRVNIQIGRFDTLSSILLSHEESGESGSYVKRPL
ncbi:unnamed protein product [Citrullus colocynthis]|uniref:Uncharacterized protein n=1 Tax=Citrullus colocynthis TaxID=252529 RepID=A0ABP0YGC1_9ROSI